MMEDEDKASLYLLLLMIGLMFLILGLGVWLP